jgi:hypothetical protein
MAAAAIPLIANLAPGLISLIVGLVHKQAPIAEAVHGPSTGAVKFGDVFASVIQSLTTAATAGSIPKELPADETIKTIIQAVVSSMQLSGLLGTTAVLPAPVLAVANPQTIVLKAGQSVTITVG